MRFRIKSSNFAAENLVPQASHRVVLWIKRESGENPGQTRCCNSPKLSRKQRHCLSKMGRPCDNGISQKTCQVGHKLL